MPLRTLDTLYSTARAVSIGAAGLTLHVEELTVGGLAEVHRARAAGRPDPLGGVAGLLSAPYVAPADRGKIADAYDAAVAGGAGADDEGELAAATTREACALLRAATRRVHPKLDDETIAALVYAMTDDEHRELQMAALRPDPLSVLMRAIDRLAGTLPDTADEDGDADGPDWHAWVDRVAERLGIPYAAVRDMSLTQFFVALNAGQSPDGRDARPGEDAVATVRTWQAWFDGADGEGVGDV